MQIRCTDCQQFISNKEYIHAKLRSEVYGHNQVSTPEADYRLDPTRLQLLSTGKKRFNRAKFIKTVFALAFFAFLTLITIDLGINNLEDLPWMK